MAGVTEADSLSQGADQIHIPCAQLYRNRMAAVNTIIFSTINLEIPEWRAVR